jgi:hypothetical protein
MTNTNQHVLKQVNVDVRLHQGQISGRQLQSCSIDSAWVAQFEGMVELS